MLTVLLNQMSQDGLFSTSNPKEPLGYRATSKDIYFTLKNRVIGLISYQVWEQLLMCLEKVPPEDIPRLLIASDQAFEIETLFPDYNKKNRASNHIATVLGYMDRLLIQYYLRNQLEQIA